MEPREGSRFACPRTYRPDLVIEARRRLRLDPDQPVPRCWTWTCPGCSHLRAWGVRRFVKAGTLEATTRGDDVVFWTLTEPPSARSWDASSAALTRLMRADDRAFRRDELRLPRWVAVPEVQARGAVHWHGLTAYPTGTRSASSWRSAHRLHDRAHAFGFGFQADLQPLDLDARSAALTAWYLAKYVTKDQRVVDSVTDSHRFRRVRSSISSRRWSSFGPVGAHTRDWQGSRDHERALLDSLAAAA